MEGGLARGTRSRTRRSCATAHDARMRVIDDLDAHLARFREAVEARGGNVPRRHAAEANAYIVDVCRNAGAKLAAKSKSMATEEIGLNEALEAAGVRPVETDLGEYILQLAGEHPVHIIAPAIEKTKEDVRRAAVAGGGRPVAPELEELTKAARRQLRETSTRPTSASPARTSALPTRARSSSSRTRATAGSCRALPRVHVVLMGMERLVASLSDLAVLLRLLARSGTGQRLSTYTTLITGPRRAGEQDGPDELHVVILDNGRSKLAGGRYREMLACIRCGACLNVCPVYRKTGGARVRAGLLGADGRGARAAVGRARAGAATCRMRRRSAAPAPTRAR